jgi:nitrogen fixation protein NifQ
MKWKKFFYKQLCEREGVNACKAPSCAACDDYSKCFGSED